MKPNRCTKCKKILAPRNKSCLCNYHSTLEKKNELNSRKCFICKKISKIQMLIVINKRNRNFCTRHFNRLNECKNEKEIKNLIRELKLLSLCSEQKTI